METGERRGKQLIHTRTHTRKSFGVECSSLHPLPFSLSLADSVAHEDHTRRNSLTHLSVFLNLSSTPVFLHWSPTDFLLLAGGTEGEVVVRTLGFLPSLAHSEKQSRADSIETNAYIYQHVLSVGSLCVRAEPREKNIYALIH